MPVQYKTTETKFRKGDVVKCVDVGHNKQYMTLGKNYVISSVDTKTPGWIFYEFIGDHGIKGAATEEKLELVYREEMKVKRSDTMKVTWTKTITETQEVPSYYADDESLEGRIVDVILGPSAGKIRDSLSDSTDRTTILSALAQLEDAYKKASKIAELLE